MYYDAHSHSGGIDLFNLYTADYPVSSDLYLFADLQKKMGMSGAFVFPMPTTLYYNYSNYIINNTFIPSGLCDFPFELENKQLLIESCIYTQIKIMPLMAFSVKSEIDKQVKFLEINKEKIYGLKYHSLAEQSSIKNLNIYGKDFLKFAESNDIPILLHAGSTEYDDAEEVFDLMNSYRNLKLIVAHLGGFKKMFFKKILEYNNIYFDISPFLFNCSTMKNKNIDCREIDLDYGNPNQVFNYFFSNYGTKMLWGSDYPMTSKTGSILHGIDYEYEFFDLLDPCIKKQIGNINFSNLI